MLIPQSMHRMGFVFRVDALAKLLAATIIVIAIALVIPIVLSAVAPLYLVSCSRTTSATNWPCRTARFFPSGDRSSDQICSDLKSVI